MHVAIVTTNHFDVSKDVANGTAIFDYSLICGLAPYIPERLRLTAFATGASVLPVPIESVTHDPATADSALIASGKFVVYELALISKAFSMQEDFDLFHVNIGDGDIAMPFVPFVSKPVLITLHYILDADFMRTYFKIFQDQPHVFFVSASNSQRRLLPDLNYLETIYHGVETQEFAFDEEGGQAMMWAGRAVPAKGPDMVVELALQTGRAASLFGIPRPEHALWLQDEVLAKAATADQSAPITLTQGLSRYELIEHFQKSKLFLFPISYEEAFGLVLIEAMSCGTPIVAFAKGSIPEVIEDGVTGFIVNFSDEDIRGDWVIKKTGIEGLREAIERIYSLPEEQYRAMRQACRARVEQHFAVEKMAENYLKAYAKAIDLAAHISA